MARSYDVAQVLDADKDRFGHIPYSDAYMIALGTHLARTLLAHLGRHPYKVIAVDCDHTLWGGVCGEDGAHGIALEARHLALQQWLVDAQSRGALICLVSKNNEADVWRVFDTRPEMILTRDHLATWAINWQPKSHNIRTLANDLNLGLDAFVFLDDNPMECAQVSSELPDVWPVLIPQRVPELRAVLAHTLGS